MLNKLPTPENKTGWPWTEETDSDIYDKTIDWPKISIVTPSYNQDQFIEETIRSILLQNYPNLEYIIIDGGSTDNTVEIIKKYEKWITYWVSEPDEGQSHAINKGIEKCTGKIFNWLNSDDYLEINTLKEISYLFANMDYDIVTGKVRRFNEKKQIDIIDGVYGNFHEKSYYLKRFFQPATFLNFQVFSKIFPLSTELKYTMDIEIYLKYFLYFGYQKVIKSNKILANFRIHPESKTEKYIKFFKNEIAYTIYKLSTYLKNYNLSKSIYKNIVKGYTIKDYNISLDMNYITHKEIEETISNFMYIFFSKCYVNSNFKEARNILKYIEPQYLDKRYIKVFKRQSFLLKNMPFLLKFKRKYLNKKKPSQNLKYKDA